MPIVPVFSFSENRTFNVLPVPALKALQLLIHKWTTFSTPLFYGRLLWCPFPVDITVVCAHPPLSRLLVTPV